MNNRVVILDDMRFEEIINSFEKNLNNIKEIFHMEETNIERINQTETWSGPTQEVVYEKHKKLQKNFNPVIDGIQNYINFLKTTLSNYRQFESAINNSIDQNVDNLDVNS